MNQLKPGILYLRWITANALGEVFGLGGTFAVGVIVFNHSSNFPVVSRVLAMFLIAVASGTIEATIVGIFQWWAMRPWFPGVRARSWWLGTLLGALAAYVLGYLPTTIMDLSQASESATEVTQAEPAQWVILLLAGGLGAVAGAVLSFAQWFVLRKVAKNAGLWIPGNMLAWFCGMPIIFLGIDIVQKGLALGGALLVMALVLLLTGIVVGMIHGFFLVRISRGSTQ